MTRRHLDRPITYPPSIQTDEQRQRWRETVVEFREALQRNERGETKSMETFHTSDRGERDAR
jgi:hypothetical protein